MGPVGALIPASFSGLLQEGQATLYDPIGVPILELRAVSGAEGTRAVSGASSRDLSCGTHGGSLSCGVALPGRVISTRSASGFLTASHSLQTLGCLGRGFCGMLRGVCTTESPAPAGSTPSRFDSA